MTWVEEKTVLHSNNYPWTFDCDGRFFRDVKKVSIFVVPCVCVFVAAVPLQQENKGGFIIIVIL